MKYLLRFIVGIILLPIIIIYSGWITKIIWNWHIPIIFGLPEITIVQSIAISLVVGWMRFKNDKHAVEKDDEDYYTTLFENMLAIIFMGLFVLLTGWILTLFY